MARASYLESARAMAPCRSSRLAGGLLLLRHMAENSTGVDMSPVLCPKPQPVVHEGQLASCRSRENERIKIGQAH